MGAKLPKWSNANRLFFTFFCQYMQQFWLKSIDIYIINTIYSRQQTIKSDIVDFVEIDFAQCRRVGKVSTIKVGDLILTLYSIILHKYTQSMFRNKILTCCVFTQGCVLLSLCFIGSQRKTAGIKRGSSFDKSQLLYSRRTRRKMSVMLQ